MRFMVLFKATQDSEAGKMPTPFGQVEDGNEIEIRRLFGPVDFA